MELAGEEEDIVSIPRRVLRGFRGSAARRAWVSSKRFNTPEGVEGFSRAATQVHGTGFPQSCVSIPRRVLRGFRVIDTNVDFEHLDGFNTPEGVEGFSSEPRYLGQGKWASFNTPEGVEGFSRRNPGPSTKRR